MNDPAPLVSEHNSEQANATLVETKAGTDTTVNTSLEQGNNIKNDTEITNNDTNLSLEHSGEIIDLESSSEDSSDEIPAALDLSISPDKLNMDIDAGFDNSFEKDETDEEEDYLNMDSSLDDVDPSEFQSPILGSDPFFETPFTDELAANSDTYLLAATPVPSPQKSPNIATPSSRVVSGSLKIMKRRKVGSPAHTTNNDDTTLNNPTPLSIDEASPLPRPKLRITPSKSRSFSTPLINPKQRMPSLQDKPIPILSPPSPTHPHRSIKNMSARSVSHSFVYPIPSTKTPRPRRRNSSDLTSLPAFSDESSDESSTSSPRMSSLTPLRKESEPPQFTPKHVVRRTPQDARSEKQRSSSYQLAPPTSASPPLYKSPTKRSPTAPLSPITLNLATTTRKASNTFSAPQSPTTLRLSPAFRKSPNDSKTAALSTKESLLDQKIMNLRKLIDLTHLAQSYQESNEDEKLAELEDKWREVAQKSVSYLRSQSRDSAEQAGAMKAFLRRTGGDKDVFLQLEGYDDELISQLEEYDDEYDEESIDLEDMTPEDRELFLAQKEKFDEEFELDSGITKALHENDEDYDQLDTKSKPGYLKVEYEILIPQQHDSE